MSTRRHTIALRISVLPLVIAATTAHVVPVLAQEQQGAGLEEIVVTAQRREESLQNTPIAISAFTEGRLRDMGVFGVVHVGDFSPNVTMERQPTSNADMGVSIRGVGTSETSLLADPKVGVYIDGIYLSRTIGSVFDVIDLERIEVLRGTQGTLFGKNTTGGAINVTTKKPSGELAARVDVSAGNYGYLRYGGSVDLPAFGDVAAKISYMGMETDGWARNHYRGAPVVPAHKVEHKLASEDNDAYRIALRWTPTASLALDYSYDRTDKTSVMSPFQITEVKTGFYDGFTTTPFDYRFYGGSLYQQMAATVGNPKKRREHYELDSVTDQHVRISGHALTVAWEMNDSTTFRYLYGKRKTDADYGSEDFDGGAYTARDLFYGVFVGEYGEIPMPGFHGDIEKTVIDMESHEIQVIGTAMDERLKYTGGLFYYDEDVEQSDPQTFVIPIAFLTPQGIYTPELGSLYELGGFCPAEYGGYLCIGTQRLPVPGPTDTGVPGLVDFRYGQNAKSWAAYAQGTYALSDRWDMTLGLRYTEDRKSAFLYNQDVAGTSSQAPGKGREKWENISYFINGNYSVTDDVSVYLTYATGYNSGGFNARATNLPAFRTPFDEEKVKTVELGLKSTLLDNRLRLNMALFSTDYTDIQISQFEAGSGGASSRMVNAGSGTYKGIEFDVTMVPVDGLTIDLTYGYLDAKFDDYIARNPQSNLLEDISRVTTVPHAPENTASLGVQYDFMPSDFGQLSMRMDVAYKDSSVFHPFNNQYDSADSRTLLNARVTMKDIRLGRGSDGALRVSLWGRNLTDEEYRQWGIDFGTLGFAGAVYGEPRTYGIDITYSYN